MAIATLEQFRDYIKTEIGSGQLTDQVIVVEVSDGQINQQIDNAVQFFQQYGGGEGYQLDYVTFDASAGVGSYPMPGLRGVLDVELSLGVDGINTMFSPTNMLLFSDFVGRGSIFGPADRSSGMNLTSYDTAMNYLKEIKNKFGSMFTVKYNQNREILTIYPTPTQNVTGVLAVYKKETAINLYNHYLVKKLATGRVCRLWGGFNLAKYGNSPMPDGMTVNWSTILDLGKELILEAEEAIRAESEPTDFFFG